MDINNNQQINTFLKGMNTDVSDALIDSSQYRYAENLRLVTGRDSNEGELHMIDGTVMRHGNFRQYLIETSSTDNIEIVHLTSIRKYVVVIVKNATQRNWYILISNDKGETFKRIFGPCNDPIWDDNGVCSISSVCRWESDNNVKLYFTDNTGKHGIMSRLIDEDHQDVTNDITELTGYQDVAVKQPTVSISNTPGQLKAARVQYAYRLYKYGGGATSISPLSKMLSLYKSNNYEGYESEKISDRAVDISLIYNQSEINSTLNRIQIFRINYVQQGQEPTVNLIYDDSFNGEVNYTDTGINIEQLSVSEFLSYIQMRIRPKIIESKGDYLYAGNISYVQDDVDEALGITGDTVPGLTIRCAKTDLETLTLENNQYNYKDQNKTTLRRGETYRYGIIFYDENGRASSVKWIGDLEIPDWQDDDIVIDTVGSEVFKTKRVYAKVTVPYIEGCKGFEIVRCLRTTATKKILFQGMIGFPQETYEYYTKDGVQKSVKDKCAPSGFITLQDMKYIINPADVASGQYLDKSESTGDLLQFVCPEYAYQPDDVEDILKNYKSQVSIKNVISYYIRTRAVRGNDETLYGPYTKHSSKGQLFGITNNIVEYYSDCIPNAGSYIENFAVNHVVPSGINNRSNYVFRTTGIKDIAFAKQPDPKSWENLTEVTFQDDSTPIGGMEYINWTAPTVLHYSPSDINNVPRPLYHIGTGGRTIIIKPTSSDNQPIKDASANSTPIYTGESSDYATTVHRTDVFLPITVVNIVNESATYGDRRYSAYYSFGNYFDASHLGTTVDVYDGDAYIQTFNYNAAHYAGYYRGAGATVESGQWYEETLCTVYSLPIETDIDLRAQCGERFIDSDNAYIQDEPMSFPNGYAQTTPSYVYNTAYNQEAVTVSNTSQEYTDIDSFNYDTRIHHSQLKTNGEQIDNWLEFKAADYIDVDSRYGQITQMKLFKDRLIYWQDTATGVISANDRTIITDSDDNQIILGNGGVMQRFDYITTLYGMKPNQFADTQSNTTLYWWDGHNKELLAYGGEGVIPLGTIKSVKNYLNKKQEVDKPHLFYDEKYKELIASVVHTYDIYKESLVYNEHVGAFTSIYRFTPLFSTITEGETLVADKDRVDVYSIKEGTFDSVGLFGTPVFPLVQYVVNNQNTYNKTFDIATFGGRFYGGDDLNALTFTFDTPLKQNAVDHGNSLITNREYDFRLNIPRNNNSAYGDRMRGKTMQCELKSSSSSPDFSLQYIVTKYRMSWS